MGSAAFIAAHEAPDVGLPASGLFVGATYLLASLPSSQQETGVEEAGQLSWLKPHVVGVPETAVE